MTTLRHWRQRWNADAPLVFIRRLKMGDGFVLPGDPVTDEMREKLGLHRLRRWWEGGAIARADQQLPTHVAKAMAERQQVVPQEYPLVVKAKGPWYEVTMAKGAEPIKVCGKKKLEELLT